VLCGSSLDASMATTPSPCRSLPVPCVGLLVSGAPTSPAPLPVVPGRLAVLACGLPGGLVGFGHLRPVLRGCDLWPTRVRSVRGSCGVRCCRVMLGSCRSSHGVTSWLSGGAWCVAGPGRCVAAMAKLARCVSGSLGMWGSGRRRGHPGHRRSGQVAWCADRPRGSHAFLARSLPRRYPPVPHRLARSGT